MRKHRLISSQREEVKATLFFCCISIIMASGLITAFLSSGSIVLGTEVNTAGLVEYLCLGQGCEGITNFRWID